MLKTSRHTIQRLILYRKILKELIKNGVGNIYSHRLGSLSGGSPAQVRRDIMAIGYSGSPSKGYDTAELENSISKFLFNPQGDKVILVGLGHLGRAIINYCDGMDSPIKINATFDIKNDIAGRIVHGIKCYHINELNLYIKENRIKIGIITVPLEAAQDVTDVMINSGIMSILNFTYAKLKVPSNIFLENLDMMMSLEKASYFANNNK